MAEPGATTGTVGEHMRDDRMRDEGALFEELCELDDAALAQRLQALERAEPALAARLRRLLEIDVAYGAHTARNVMGSVEATDPVGDISDIGPFRLLRQIGRGGMGVVYLGERRSDFEQRVAIKIMPRFTADAAARARFAQERRILAQLRHPNICSILDGGELDDGTPWLAMEFVPGETLCAWSAGRGLGVRERIALFLQLCDAVQYAHRNLVIHRDLKDSNVLVDEAGHVKLLDFGIAKSLAPSAGDGHTALQDRFFSPMTAAPEQIRGERVTVATDVYALGALLHQLLCGFLPFERPQRPPHALQREILEVPPPKMSEALQRERTTARGAAFDTIAADGAQTGRDAAIAARALRGELDAIVAHCLRKDAAERYAEVGDLARDLRAWLSGHPIAIARGDRLYRLGKFLRRHRLPVALGTAAAASVLVALAVTLWQAAALRVERDAAEAARQRSEIDRDRARAVADFMRDTFEEADPGKASRGGLMARDLIERGTRKLPALDGQRDVQAELALMLAESFSGMGLVRESEGLLTSYRPAIDALSAKDPDVRWRSLSLDLTNRLQTGDVGPELDRMLEQAATLARSPTQHVQLARLRERRHVRRSEFAEAAQVLQAAWDTHGRALDPESKLRLRIDLASALLNTRRLDDARAITESIGREALDGYDPALQIRALRLLAREIAMRDGDRAAKLAVVERWQSTAERLYGSESIEAASAYAWRVDVTPDPREQEALVHRAYAIQRAKLPPISAERAFAEFNLAYFYLDVRDQPARAEPHVARAVEIGREIYSRAHADVRTFELRWARILNALGRHARCLEALSDPPAPVGNPNLAARSSGLRLELAKAALALGRRERAAREVAAAKAVWPSLGRPMSENAAREIARIEASLGVPADGR